MGKRINARDIDMDELEDDDTVTVSFDGSDDSLYLDPNEDSELIRLRLGVDGKAIDLVAYDGIDDLITGLRYLKREIERIN